MSRFNQMSDPVIATNYLAECLRDGTLMLYLGAGVSKDFGLPGWLSLVNELRKHVGLAELDSNASSEQLQSGADEVADRLKTKEELLDLIERYLYQNLPRLETATIFNNVVLIAVAALLMGSNRGHVRRVVTLNYDNLLEWVLSVFGFSVKTICELPQLEGSEDVTIYHPHGYIPMPSLNNDRSNFVILGLDDANLRLGTLGDPWSELTRHLLQTSVCLFIGMSPTSLSDRVLAPLFTKVGRDVSSKRPLGIWLVKDVLSASKLSDFQRNNIYPIQFETPLKIAEFLLNICKAAGEKTSI